MRVLTIKILELMMRHNSSFWDMLLVSVLIQEFLLTQVIDKKDMKQRLDQVTEIKNRLRATCKSNISGITVQDINDFQLSNREEIEGYMRANGWKPETAN
jgi:hypothetical protein